MDTIEVTLKVNVTQQDIDDIMVSALEGGICYWCRKAEVIGDYLGEYASEQISRGGKLRLHTEDDGAYVLTKETFLNGLKRYLEESNGNKLDYDGSVDVGMIDADAADSIIQYAVFGGLVYG